MQVLKVYFLFLCLITISSARASLLIEPVAGYNFGTKAEFEVGKNYRSGTGPSFGGRLGYQKLGLQFGIDYLNSNIDLDHRDFDSNLKTSEWAGFVGYKFPILFRVYGGYIFSALGESKYNNGSGIQKLQLQGGHGYKAGLSFTGIPFLNLNFEYRSGEFSRYKLGILKSEDDLRFQSFLVSISLPLNF